MRQTMLCWHNGSLLILACTRGQNRRAPIKARIELEIAMRIQYRASKVIYKQNLYNVPVIILFNINLFGSTPTSSSIDSALSYSSLKKPHASPFKTWQNNSFRARPNEFSAHLTDKYQKKAK
jgi:hypothetical protein